MEKKELIQVTIFGGTGHYGRKITEKLIEKGIRTRVYTRDPAGASGIFGERAELFAGNVSDSRNVNESLEGSAAVIVSLSAMSWDQARIMQEVEVGGLKNIMNAMVKHNIQRLVFISVYYIDRDFVEGQKSSKLADPKSEAEKLIRESGFNWTILGCPPSYELFFRLLRKNSITVPGGGRKPIVCISADDVGEIAAQAVLRYDLKGMRFRLSGPETVNFPQFADKVASILGKPVKHRSVPLWIVNVITFILKIINPFPRLIYQALKMMNHFPSRIAEKASEDHALLKRTFNIRVTTIDDEIRKRFKITSG